MARLDFDPSTVDDPPPEVSFAGADPAEVAALQSMMGNAVLMFEFAQAKGFTEEQTRVWLANMGNANYVLPVGLGLVPPEPQEPPPVEPPVEPQRGQG